MTEQENKMEGGLEENQPSSDPKQNEKENDNTTSSEEGTASETEEVPTTAEENTPVEEEIVAVEKEANETEKASESDELEDDEDDDEDDHDEDDSDHHVPDYEKLSLEELVSKAEEAQNLTAREGLKRVRDLRPFFEDKWNLLKQEQEEKWNEEFADTDFKFNDGGLRNRFNSAFRTIKAARNEEKERIEKEKESNLKLKEDLLEELRLITEKDETDASLNEVKEIQRKWRQIRVVPHEKVEELWKTYHFYLDKFYDNHSINIELKELDRKKNLETKIELCKKVDEISEEKSLKKSFILLNKYTEEFRNTGPVPREYNEEIWNRFKAACDKIYNEKKEQAREQDDKRKVNLEHKQVLVEKAALIAAEVYDKPKTWKAKTDELDQLFAEWKKIGPVPRQHNQKIWKEFRAGFNEFYKNKSAYFKELHNDRKDNLTKKEALCVQAEKIVERDDFGPATKELLKLQEDWKKIGPVPDKVSNAIWKRFRKACDAFFNRKQSHFKHIKDEENENLKRKNDLIERLEALLKEDSAASKDDAMKIIQEVSATWNSIGFVPFKQKDKVQKKFSAVSNDVIRKFGLDQGSVDAGKARDHYAKLANLPNGNNRLNDEIRRIRKKIGFLSGEVETWENNMGFFAMSKTANKLKEDIEKKIEKANKQINKLKAEIKEIRSIMDQGANGDQK